MERNISLERTENLWKWIRFALGFACGGIFMHRSLVKDLTDVLKEIDVEESKEA